MMIKLVTVIGTLRIEQYWYEEYKETLIDVIDDLTRHYDIAKLKFTSSWYTMKYKATTGVKNTASFIP